MGSTASFELSQLIGASDAAQKEAAWEDLIARHTRLLLAITRTRGEGQDEAMDRYAYILEKLRENDFRRLRTFDPNAGASFSTWLTVAARRLCLDHHRARYGRYRTESVGDPNELRAARRTLLDYVKPEVDVELIPDSSAESAEARAVYQERNAILQAELARLTPRERLLLTLRFEDGQSAAQVALLIGAATPFAVYRQVNHILSRLRKALEARGVDGVSG